MSAFVPIRNIILLATTFVAILQISGCDRVEEISAKSCRVISPDVGQITQGEIDVLTRSLEIVLRDYVVKSEAGNPPVEIYYINIDETQLIHVLKNVPSRGLIVSFHSNSETDLDTTIEGVLNTWSSNVSLNGMGVDLCENVYSGLIPRVFR